MDFHPSFRHDLAELAKVVGAKYRKTLFDTEIESLNNMLRASIRLARSLH
jgi:hypothetical protein